MLSTLAVLCMTVNLVLATRSRWVERRMLGLDKVFAAHRTLGLSIALLVVSHFLLVPKSIGWVPSKYVGYPMIALLLTMIFVSSAPRFPWAKLVDMRYEHWKLVHRFNGGFLMLATLHSLLAHTYVKLVPGLAAYVYGMVAIGLGAWTYREVLFDRFHPPELHTIESFRVLRDEVSEIVLAEPMRADRVSGQFAFLSLSGGRSREQHPFTISSPAAESVRFSINASGDFTRRLAEQRIPLGTTAAIEGPYGAFTARAGGRRQLWIAGGIGITPFLAMAGDVDPGTEAHLVWSVHDAEAAVYRDELDRLASVHPNLRFELHVSTTQGHLDVASLQLDAPASEYSAFVCGPLPMRLAVIEQLRRIGVPRSAIHFEEFRLR